MMILGEDWRNGLGLLLLLGLDMGLKGEGEEGVEGVDEVFDESPKRVLAWLMRDNKRVSGPQAKRIISFSPGS